MPDQTARTSAAPIVVDGVTFHCYRDGVLRYVWISEDGRLEVRRRSGLETYYARVDGDNIWGANPDRAKRFRSQSAAMLAAVLRARAQPIQKTA